MGNHKFEYWKWSESNKCQGQMQSNKNDGRGNWLIFNHLNIKLFWRRMAELLLDGMETFRQKEDTKIKLYSPIWDCATKMDLFYHC